MFSGLLTIAVTCIMFRMIVFYRKKSVIKMLLVNTDIAADVKTYCMDNRDQYQAVLQKVNSFVDFAYKMYSMFTITVLMMMIVPLFNKEKVLLIKVWVPLDIDWKSNEIAFWIMYVFTNTTMAFCAISIGRCLFVWYIMLNISLKYEILGYRLTNLKVKQHSSRMDIISCIKYHLDIKSNLQKFYDCFNSLFTYQIVTSNISLCAEAFVLAFIHVETPFEYLLYFATMNYLLFEIFFILYYGNEITVNSEKLSTFLFQSKWFDQSHGIRKDIKIVMEILKRPVRLLVGFVIVFPLDLATFTSILNMSYSLFNILRNS
ncbi:putative odorant receptor 71a [Bradysia coprophila]|uniref:putative odorant receptor 71a n=1 Tax=Bradysia coprophila TaxID=38358 RepID=UPI00187D73CE|nr:putative odorant receptor 71a [Bradysia coprophila]